MLRFGGSQWKRSCIGAEPATRRREGISRSRSEWQATWALATGCRNSGLTSGLAPQEPGWVGHARGLLEALETGASGGGVAPKQEELEGSTVPPLFSPPRDLEPPLLFQHSRNQLSSRTQGSRAFGFLPGPRDPSLLIPHPTSASHKVFGSELQALILGPHFLS